MRCLVFAHTSLLAPFCVPTRPERVRLVLDIVRERIRVVFELVRGQIRATRTQPELARERVRVVLELVRNGFGLWAYPLLIRSRTRP